MNRSKPQLSLLSVFVIIGVFLVNYFFKKEESKRPSNSTTRRERARVRETSTDEPATSTSTNRSESGPTGVSSEGNLLLGNPSNAVGDANGSADNYLLERSQYSMSFNHSRGGPNWVSWHVDSSNLGDASRGKFRPDPELPADWRITPKDYSGSGYDRGHMCPSADRNANREDNDATFYMSNMVPQTAELNQHVWADLENYVRDTVRGGNEVYQLCGPIGNRETIADGKVVAPASCWKVIVVLPEGKNDLSRINAQTRVIAVLMPNENSDDLKNGDWHTYLTSVKKIEAATKLNLLSKLPTKVQTALENKVDQG